MSRTSVLAAVRTAHACDLCGEEITHDVVRVDEGRIYHLRCFRRYLPGGALGLFECPKCRTMGCTWEWAEKSWRTCTLCNGGGYLSAPGDACGN